MCKLFDEWSKDIEAYCVGNGLSFEKAKGLAKCWGKDDLLLQYYNPNGESAKKGLLDETPAPLVLYIKKENGKLIFEQTEHTKQYLS